MIQKKISKNSIVFNDIVKYGPILSPPKPELSGYTFIQWEIAKDSSGDNNKWDNNKIVNANMTLYAKWEMHGKDGEKYATVRLGNQVWMQQNMRTINFFGIQDIDCNNSLK